MLKKAMRFLSGAAAVSLLATVFYAGVLSKELPEGWTVRSGQTLQIAGIPVTSVPEGAVRTGGAAGSSYKAELRLFGVVAVRQVQVQVAPVDYVVPDGSAFGIKLYTAGVMVNGIAGVDTADGIRNPAANAGVRKGDILIAVNGKTVNTNAEVSALIGASGGAACTLNLRRGGVDFEVKLKPARSVTDGTYKAGLWVRDSTGGIGTITWFDSQSGLFAGLGHAVCDVDTGKVLPLLEGEAVSATVTDVAKGEKGQTGELLGTLADARLGSLLINGNTGVYGRLNEPRAGKEYPVALRQQVHTGSATVLASVDEKGPRAYSIRIEQVRYNSRADEHNMVVRVTDSQLIARTGGIVQGMSGSPILQDGRVVGAITHVFIGDPQKGYAIFAENMLHTAKTLENKD